jgi:hypothetical protein
MKDIEKIAKQLAPVALKRLKNVSPAKERETQNRKKKMREGGEEWAALAGL